MAKLNFTRTILPVIAFAGFIFAAVLVVRGLPDRTEETPEIVPPTTPSTQRESGTVAGAGIVEPAGELVRIGTAINGIVEQVYVKAGDRVNVGSPLFRIDTRDVRAAQESALARRASAAREIDAARTQLKVAQNQLALFTDVKDPRAVSRLEIIDRQGVVANAQAQLDLARAQLKTADAEVQSLSVDRERRTVRAPIAAQVLQVKTRVGEYASSAPGAGSGTQDPLLTLGVTEPLYVRIDIDENEIERLAIGNPAVVSTRGNAAAPVTVTFVRAEPQVVPKRSLTNSSSERVDVRVLQLIYELPAGGHTMFVGQQVDAFVPARSAPKSGATK